MKLFDAQTIRRWDETTMVRQGIRSDELMERAGIAFCEMLTQIDASQSYCIACGTGNNGGDGLVIARWLREKNLQVRVVVVGDAVSGSADFKINLGRAIAAGVLITYHPNDVPDFSGENVVIDALLGTGISRPAEGQILDVIRNINRCGARVISVDLPSGLPPDPVQWTFESVQANHTVTFQRIKRSFLFPENDSHVGECHVADIGLDRAFEDEEPSSWHMTTHDDVVSRCKPISRFAYKNQKGHLQVMAGSYGKMGAAVLCCHGAMRGGCGLVTAYVPSCGVQVMQTSIPEVMCVADEGEKHLHSSRPDSRMNALAIGPGIGTQPETVLMLRQWIEEVTMPMVIDADALNIVAQKNMFSKLPKGTVITPHVGEFDRLFGPHENSSARIETQMRMSAESGVVIVLKGHHTSVSLPTGDIYFNSTGNEGMATAGSGDVLTGLIGSLLAQGYSPTDAAVLGVYLHGLAGDHVAAFQGKRGMMASDIAEAIVEAWEGM